MAAELCHAFGRVRMRESSSMRNGLLLVGLTLAVATSTIADDRAVQRSRARLALQLVDVMTDHLAESVERSMRRVEVREAYRGLLYPSLGRRDRRSDEFVFDDFESYSEPRILAALSRSCWRLLRFKMGDLRIRRLCEEAKIDALYKVLRPFERVRVVLERNVTGSSFDERALVDECVDAGTPVRYRGNFTAGFGEEFEVDFALQTAPHRTFAGILNVDSELQVAGKPGAFEFEFLGLKETELNVTHSGIFERFRVRLSRCE
jgi:hypothetical protein